MEDNTHAGQGPVMLDIGGDIGAIIVSMPAGAAGQEIEARPIAGLALAQPHTHTHAGHEHGHDDQHHQLVHVGVLQRPSADGSSFTAVFGELVEGTYELYVKPDGPVALTVAVIGGEVSNAVWPD